MTFYVYHCLINRKYSWVGIFVDFFFSFIDCTFSSSGLHSLHSGI